MSTDAKRRIFLRGSLAAGAVGVAAGAGLLRPQTVMAAWSEAAFSAKEVPGALNALMGSEVTEPSDAINIKAPDIAENGAVVPVTVSTSMKADSIAVFVEKNASPLAANFLMGDTTKGFVSSRLKMGKTSSVIAVVKSGGKAMSARKEVKVTIGGCGG